MARLPKKRAALACLALALAVVAAAVPQAAAARGAPASPPTATPTHHRSAHPSRGGGTSSFFMQQQQQAPQCTNCTGPNPVDNPADKVKNWYKTCAEAGNDDCCACDLWVKAKASKDPSIYSGTSNKRAKIIPTTAMQGLENIVRDGDVSTNFLWEKALSDAKSGQIPGVDKTDKCVAVMNSLHTRTRHQMHTHVGRAKDEYYGCLDALIQNPPKAWTWQPVNLGKTSCNAIKAGGSPMEAYAVSVPADKINTAIREGFLSKSNTFTTATKDVTNPTLARVTAVVQPNSSGQYTVILITNAHDYSIFG